MQYLELLAPARNKDIGIAAIDCGADAVYIAGPNFGARKEAGNSYEDIAQLCDYAHKFGVKVFVTFNIIIYEEELQEAHNQMLLAQKAGADAFIIRDPIIFTWKDITIPLHASTQCAIRTAQRAQYFESLGASRLVLERELSLQTVKEIAESVSCELEFFVHGALCVCYSGDCRLSQFINGRSADRGECVQACRSLYDLVDEKGKVLLRNKAILSLKDLNLINRLEELADARVCSFKIEGRLKNASYVKNIVRDYDLALNKLVSKYPNKYCRASFGHIVGTFTPNSEKTFNRGYTEAFFDGKRGKWSSMDAPKSMGELIGEVAKLRRSVDNCLMQIELKPNKELKLNNGDGFAFVTKDGIQGFRSEIVNGLSIKCKNNPNLKEGDLLYRNIDIAFEKALETAAIRREIEVIISINIRNGYLIDIEAISSDGRVVNNTISLKVPKAENGQRLKDMFFQQLSKRTEHYSFTLKELNINTSDGSIPFLSASILNGIRRTCAEQLNATHPKRDILNRLNERIKEIPKKQVLNQEELMRSKYCIRYELGICKIAKGGCEKLYLLNNGRRFLLNFDCKNCEMIVLKDI